jgi:hypothetical protein
MGKGGRVLKSGHWFLVKHLLAAGVIDSSGLRCCAFVICLGKCFCPIFQFAS